MEQQVRSEPRVEATPATGAELEALATLLADAVEEWAYRGGATTTHDADTACNMAGQIRMLGWLAAESPHDPRVEPDGVDRASVIEALHAAFARAIDLILGPHQSGPRRKVTPPAGFIAAESLGEDEETVVRRPKVRVSNRILR